MTDKAAQSKDQIDPRDVRFVVQADFHLASNNRPARDIYQMQNFVLDALDEGATEIRIRPYKQEGVEAARDGCGSEQRERVATPPPSPVQGDLIEAALRDALKRMLNVFDTPLSEGGMTAGAEQETCAFARAALANAGREMPVPLTLDCAYRPGHGDYKIVATYFDPQEAATVMAALKSSSLPRGKEN